MPKGSSSFQGMRRRRIRPPSAAWGLAAAGAGLLASSASALRPYDSAFLALLALATGFAAWRMGRRAGLTVAIVSALLYQALELSLDEPFTVEALRAVPGGLGLLALAVALSEVGYLVRGLAQAAMLDQVTRLPNYDLFMRFLQIEASRSMRYRLPFTLILLELRDLESYSRTFGYWRVNTLLKELANMMDETLRKSDVLGYMGGPQFALLLPMTNSQGALVALKRLESAVNALPLPTYKGVKQNPLTWNVGIAEFPGDGQDALDLLKAASERLGTRLPQRPLITSAGQ